MTETTTTSSAQHIKPLSADNYTEWSSSMFGLLMERGWVDHVEDNTKGATPSDATDVKAGGLDRKQDQRVIGLIFSRMEASQRVALGLKESTLASTTARQLWVKIRQHYKALSLQLMNSTFQQMAEPYDESQKMETFLIKKRETMSKLEGAGLHLPEALYCLQVLNSLPESWHTTKQILINTATLTRSANPEEPLTSSLTFDSMSTALIGEEVNRAALARTATSQTETMSALVARSGQPRTSPATRRTGHENLICRWCQIKGHIEAHCNGKKAGKPRAPPRDGGDANVITSTSPTSEQQGAPAATSTDSTAQGNWLWAVSPAIDESTKPTVWCLDSGASLHLCCRRDMFRSLSDHTDEVRVGDGRAVPVHGRGTVAIDMLTPGHIPGREYRPHMVTPVSYAPGLSINLLSVPMLGRAGIHVLFHGDRALIKQDGKTIGYAILQPSNLYRVVTLTTGDGNVALAASGSEARSSPLDLWHERLGHRHHRAISQLFSSGMTADGHLMPNAVTPSSTSALSHCEPCVIGKQHRLPVPLKADPAGRAKRPLYRVHVDLMGPFNTPSLGGARYLMLIVDDYSRYTVAAALPTKDAAFSAFKEYVAMAEALHDQKVAWIRSDNGGEFVSAEFTAWLKEHGIQRELTTPYTPSQNGVVERMNRTVMEAARSIMKAAGLPDPFWAMACYFAAYTSNRCPTTSLDKMTPYEAWRGKKPSIAHMRLFGCLAYVLVRKGLRGKLDAKSTPCIFVGYSADSKSYRLWNGTKLVTSRDVHFVEERWGYTYLCAGEAAAGGNSDNEGAEIATANPYSPLNTEESDSEPPAQVPARAQPPAKLPAALRKLQDKLPPGPHDLAPATVGQEPTTGPIRTRSQQHQPPVSPSHLRGEGGGEPS